MRRALGAMALALMCVVSSVSVYAQQAPVAPAAVQSARPERPFAEIKRVLIISVDGMRPDLMLRGDTPNMHQLFAGGSYSFWARTTEVSITFPSHTSMLTGVSPEKHGILWNDDSHPDTYPLYPSILDLAHKNGYTTALVTTKSKLHALARADSTDNRFVPVKGKTYNDTQAGEAACDIIRKYKPEVMMIHFGEHDAVGHSKGWGSVEQQTVLANVDRQIGNVFKALDDAGVRGDTLIIVTADHGGAGKWHGKDDPRARHIPWIASGPKIRNGLDLDTDRGTVINTEDTFATAAYVLGVKPEMPVDGKPVMRVFEMNDLITPSGK